MTMPKIVSPSAPNATAVVKSQLRHLLGVSSFTVSVSESESVSLSVSSTGGLLDWLREVLDLTLPFTIISFSALLSVLYIVSLGI